MAMQCKKCKGTTRTEFGKCYACDGTGTWPDFGPVEAAAIIKAVKGKRSPLRSGPPRRDTQEGTRTYYVWRMARFHGGADVTLPVTATILIGGDPARALLDELADRIARAAFGTDIAGAARWNGAMTGRYLTHDPVTGNALPDSTQQGGPAHDWTDPETAGMDEAERKADEMERDYLATEGEKLNQQTFTFMIVAEGVDEDNARRDAGVGTEGMEG